MAIAYEGKHPDVQVKYTMIPMTNGEYQTKLKAALGTADAPDVIALEAAFVKSYVESKMLADLGDLLPAAKAADTYPFVTDVGSDAGVTKAYAYQATPGALFYRRSLAKEYFGTDDPAETPEDPGRHGQIRRRRGSRQAEVRRRHLHGRFPRRFHEPVLCQSRPALGG